MKILLALAPSLAVCVAVFALRWSALTSAMLAAVLSLLIWAAGAFQPLTPATVASAGADTALLTAIVVSVIVPGLLFVEATRRRNSQQAIGDFVAALDLSQSRTAILIASGIGIFVESLTGMGVSFLVTMPLLLQLVSRQQALGLGLIGMGLMPWGALALPTLLGAKLAGVGESDFAREAWLQSAPVALILPLLALALVRGRALGELSLIGLATSLGLLSYLAMAGATWTLGAEAAGISAGLSVILFFALTAAGSNLWSILRARAELWPYLVLIAAVIGQKVLVVVLASQGVSFTISASQVTWSVLATPGLALLVASAIAMPRFDAAVLISTVKRAYRPVAATAMFLLSARVLIESGGATALADASSSLSPVPALMSVGLLGGVSGFLTGSGISGNALFMPSAAAIGQSFGQVTTFAALQNAAAAHTALASLPIASVMLATLPDRKKDDDRSAFIIAMKIAGGNLILLLAWAAVRLLAGIHVTT
jgi:lactate permease